MWTCVDEGEDAIVREAEDSYGTTLKAKAQSACAAYGDVSNRADIFPLQQPAHRSAFRCNGQMRIFVGLRTLRPCSPGIGLHEFLRMKKALVKRAPAVGVVDKPL